MNPEENGLTWNNAGCSPEYRLFPQTAEFVVGPADSKGGGGGRSFLAHSPGDDSPGFGGFFSGNVKSLISLSGSGSLFIG